MEVRQALGGLACQLWQQPTWHGTHTAQHIRQAATIHPFHQDGQRAVNKERLPVRHDVRVRRCRQRAPLCCRTQPRCSALPAKDAMRSNLLSHRAS